MIVFTQAYADAEEAAGRPMLNSRIGWHTLTRDASASDILASSESAAGPADSPLRSDSYSYWEPPTLPATWTLNLPGSPIPNVNYVGIGAHNLGSSGCTVTAYTNNGVSSGSPTELQWEIVAQPHTPVDDSAIILLDTTRGAAQLRIVISGGTGPRIGVIYVGEILAMQSAIRGSHVPLNLSRQTVLRTALSRGGQFLGQTYQRRGYRTSVAFDLLDGDWYRSTFDPFVMAARRYPYFLAWRPGDRQDEVGYVWTADDISPSTMGFDDLMTVSWSVFALGDE